MALCVAGVRRGHSGVTPDGGAAGGVGDVHAVAKELGHEARIARLGATGAGARELEQRLIELRALDRLMLPKYALHVHAGLL